jgi:hypothetical protein
MWVRQVFLVSFRFLFYFNNNSHISARVTRTLHYTYFLLWRCDPTRVMASSFLRFLDHIQRRTTVGRTPLDEWSARRTDLYLTTHNTHNKKTSMPPVGFEPRISAGERPQTYVLDRAATGTGCYIILSKRNKFSRFWLVTYCQADGRSDQQTWQNWNLVSAILFLEAPKI